MASTPVGAFGSSVVDVDALYMAALGHPPYEYQRVIAREGLPEVLSVPTGAGKTAACVLGWLYRRCFHPDGEVRRATPRRLVFVLPMRVLVEQTLEVVRGVLARLKLGDQVGCYVLMGGEPRDADLRMRSERDAIVVGTIDMVVSRLLNRGYGESRFVWPIDFGLLHNGCHYVFDEVQLLGPALPTTRQLHGLRAQLGTALPCGSTWMSATVDPQALSTVDAPAVNAPLGLSPADRSGPLAARLDAPKRVEELPVGTDDRGRTLHIAEELARRHRPGTLTLAVVNTVERARQLHAALAKSSLDADLVLLHSRFRPADRRAVVDKVTAPVDPDSPGRLVVSTQVVEAGVDISATVLFTEVAPWPSLVQRAGRCNRDGLAVDATLLWADLPPNRSAPYEADDLAAAAGELRRLDGHSVTPASIGESSVPVRQAVVPVLRRKDLLELFDTAPDLDGNDLDVARFIRDTDDLDVTVTWRELPKQGKPEFEDTPRRDERCPVPVAEVRKLARDHLIWRRDHLAGAWVRVSERDVRPGQVLLVDTGFGRYTPETGWDPDRRAPVEPVVVPAAEPAVDDQDLDGDPLSFAQARWLSLEQHLADVELEVARLLNAHDDADLGEAQRAAAILAGRFHDIGKAHPAFQQLLAKQAEPTTAPAGLLAKSPKRERVAQTTAAGDAVSRLERPYFRHELASLLALMGEGTAALRGVEEADLVRYLVAAHHGRIRLGCRPHPSENVSERVLGVADGDVVPELTLRAGTVPSSTLRLAPVQLGASDLGESWTARALRLRDRGDLGPFRLAFLEAVVRLADWRASASPLGAGEWGEHG